MSLWETASRIGSLVQETVLRTETNAIVNTAKPIFINAFLKRGPLLEGCNLTHSCEPSKLRARWCSSNCQNWQPTHVASIYAKGVRSFAEKTQEDSMSRRRIV